MQRLYSSESHRNHKFPLWLPWIVPHPACFSYDFSPQNKLTLVISERTLKTPLRRLRLRLACWAPGMACSECAGCDVACLVVCSVTYVKLRLLFHYHELFSNLSTVDSLYQIPSLFSPLALPLPSVSLSLPFHLSPCVCHHKWTKVKKKKKKETGANVRIPKEPYPSQPTPNDTVIHFFPQGPTT